MIPEAAQKPARQAETNPAKSPTRMKCLEIWGGNNAIEQSFEGAGVDIYVHSQPYQGAVAGGDIYYLTSCASGRVSRFLLADVSGHGEAASGLASTLRAHLRTNVNKISQEGFVAAMNHEFGAVNEGDGFATAVVATFFEPTRMLDISVAGHPYPIYYRASKSKWVHLDPASFNAAEFENMPLGVVEHSGYPGRKIKTELNDMFLLYTDAFIESFQNEDLDATVGISGMVEILNRIGNDPQQIIPRLRSELGSLATGNLDSDDASLILGHFTNTKVRFRDNVLAPIRYAKEVCDVVFSSTVKTAKQKFS